MKRCSLYLLVLTQLLACATVEPTRLSLDAKALSGNADKVISTKRWSLVGRLSIKNEKESWLTVLNWRHDAQIDDLTLSTSLGGVVARLYHADSVFSMADDNGVIREVSEAELQSTLGFSPPLQHLKFWIRGVSNPSAEVMDESITLAGEVTFKQGGWSVKQASFDVFDGLMLPTRVTLKKNGLTLKMVVDKWLT